MTSDDPRLPDYTAGRRYDADAPAVTFHDGALCGVCGLLFVEHGYWRTCGPHPHRRPPAAAPVDPAPALDLFEKGHAA